MLVVCCEVIYFVEYCKGKKSVAPVQGTYYNLNIGMVGTWAGLYIIKVKLSLCILCLWFRASYIL